METRTYAGLAVLVVSLSGCADDDRETGGAFSGSGLTAADGDSDGPATDGANDDGDDSDGSDGSGGAAFDLGQGGDDGGTPPRPQSCEASDTMEVVDCEDKEPPSEFEATTEWRWMGTDAYAGSTVSPLVANLSDDNGDGVINLCDTPDVVLTVFSTAGLAANIFVLDGATGEPHFRIDHPVASGSTPAIGDIDGDGIPEIVAVEPMALVGDELVARLVAFEHDGALKWTGDSAIPTSDIDAVALADVDNDGDVEIILKATLTDHTGHMLWAAPLVYGGGLTWDASTAADLDGDGDLEIITANAALHHDGSEHYRLADTGPDALLWGLPQVADVDGDGMPEVLVTTEGGFAIIEHDGTVSTRYAGAGLVEQRPAVLSDLSGDGLPDLAVPSRTQLSGFDGQGGALWSASATDGSCCAGPAAFDFLGDGTPELAYGGDFQFTTLDSEGNMLSSSAHTSGTAIETAVIADVDNDGSAEILHVSNGTGADDFTLEVLGDPSDRWIAARRIWNQQRLSEMKWKKAGLEEYAAPPASADVAQRACGRVCIGAEPGRAEA